MATDDEQVVDEPAPVEAGEQARHEEDLAAPTVALVLGSGGARGYAHIGVVQVLEERGLDVVAVAGSSMGAIVGGLHAAGRLDEFTEWARGLGQFEILRLLDLSLSSPGAVRGDKGFRKVSELTEGLLIEDLRIPFTAVAVDLLAQREVWFTEGPLDVAIRASAAIPSFFTPVTLNGSVFVDGGVLNPVPVAPVATVPVDHVLAVSLNGRGPTSTRPVAETALEDEEDEWSDRLRGTAAKWFDSDLLAAVRKRLSPEQEEAMRSRLSSEDTEIDEVGSDGNSESAATRAKADKTAQAGKVDDLGAVDVLQLAFDAMQGALTRHRFAGYPPDILVSVPKNAVRTLDLHRAEEMIDIGRRLTEQALDEHGLTAKPPGDASETPPTSRQ